MIRRPPRSTLDRSSAASDVYKRQEILIPGEDWKLVAEGYKFTEGPAVNARGEVFYNAVSYTHLRAHETVLDLVCRLLLEQTKTKMT